MTDLVALSRSGEIGIITVNNPPVNALSPGVPEGIVFGVEQFNLEPAIRAIVLIGGGRTFIAGADIKEFGKITSGEKKPDIGLAQWIRRIEDSAKPVIMAIHGTALGGGLELAMSGHYRVAVASAQVGQPEVKLGIIPGAAGTQRLPRLAGVAKALEMCVYGNPILARDALECGILDDIVIGDLLEGAIEFAKEKLHSGEEWVRTRDRADKLANRQANAEAIQEARLKLGRRGRALLCEVRAIEAIEAATERPFDEGCAVEAKLFQECLFSSQSKALIHAFFGEREVAKVPGLARDTAVRAVREAAVVGAGTMGGGIAMVYANAGIPVLLKESTVEALEKGIATIRKNYENSVRKGRMDAAEMEKRLARITPVLTYDGFEKADIITEAVFESMAVKKQVFAEIDAVAKPGCILASNTSTLDLDEIASATGRPEDVIGTHFFSPANVMRLLEIVRGAKTSAGTQASAMNLAKQLKKVGVMVGNCFGFAGNRMFGPYRREAERLVLEGASPRQVDDALYEFGMAMGPLRTGDLAGLDVGWRIRQEHPEAGPAPIEDRLCEMGRYGQKTGSGWYRYDAQRNASDDAEVAALIEQVRGGKAREISDEEIVERSIGALVCEGRKILAEGIAARPVDLDIIYITGYGFPAWRGGPMFYGDLMKIGV